MPILDDISKGLKKGAEKAGDALKTLEIQQEINKLEGSIKDKKLAMGEVALGLHKDKKLNIPELESLCADVDGLMAQIEEKKKMIQQLKAD